MAYIYAYAPDETDCSSIGLVGALLDDDAKFEISAGEFGELTFTHPVDVYGKWQALVNGAILKTMIPVRLCPEVKTNGQYVTTVDVYKVAETSTKTQRYVYSTKEDGKKKKLLKFNQVVTVTGVADPTDDNSRYSVRTGNISGWMERGGLTVTQQDVPVPDRQDGLESVQPSYAIRQQLFRIVSVEPSDDNGGQITVRALRIVYDLLGNVTTYKTGSNVTCNTVIHGILDNTLAPHDFSIYTDIGDSHIAFNGEDKNPIEALVDPDSGVAARWGAEVVCDDYDIYILHRAGVDRNVRIEYAKNLTGISVENDVSNVANGVRPKGQTVEGEPLYVDGAYYQGKWVYNTTRNSQGQVTAYSDELPSGFAFYQKPNGEVDGSIVVRENTTMIVPKITVLEVSDAHVEKGGDGVTKARARVMMVTEACGAFNGGCDVPEIKMSVDFVMLGDTAEYAQYKHLEPLFVYDTVHVRDRRIDVTSDISLTSISWLVRQERVSEADFGSLSDVTASIAGWQISSMDGGKIIPATVGAGQMMDGTIAARHIQTESVYTDALQAGSVTAEKLNAESVSAFSIEAVRAKINSITAQSITTDSLVAAFAHLYGLVADDIEAGHISTDSLAAVMADIVTLQAKVGSFDLQTVTNLVSSALTLQQGQANQMYITNLAVTSANLLNATIGKLVVLGDDGDYYEIGVGANGLIRTAQYDASAAEIAAGVTTDGRAIVTESTINAETITGQTIMAQEATFSTVLTAALNAGKITANDAMIASASIPMLYVTSLKSLGNSIDISANQSIQFLIGEAEDAQRTADDANETAANVRAWMTFDEEGLRQGKAGSTYSTLIDDTGFHVLQLGEKISSFAKRRLATEEVRVGQVSTSDARCVLREAGDGGLIITLEGLT